MHHTALSEMQYNRCVQDLSSSSPRQVAPYIGSIIANGAMAVVAWQLPKWWPSLVLPSYQAAVWVVLVALVIQMAGNALFLFYDEKWFRSLVEVFIHAAGLASIVTLYVLMPFDFSAISAGTVVEMAFRVGLIVAAIVTTVMFFARAVQFVAWVLGAK